MTKMSSSGVWKEHLRPVRNGCTVDCSTAFSVIVCATSSLARITSFLSTLMAHSSPVAFSLASITLPKVPFPSTASMSKSFSVYSFSLTSPPSPPSFFFAAASPAAPALSSVWTLVYASIHSCRSSALSVWNDLSMKRVICIKRIMKPYFCDSPFLLLPVFFASTRVITDPATSKMLTGPSPGAGGPVLYPRKEPSALSWNQRGRQVLMYSPRFSNHPCFTIATSSIFATAPSEATPSGSADGLKGRAG
mmetsp:Transcript_28333/g.74375  ORF Transcript_28333/g.74375 Transcript_28333/m.74375 type:complete len:249 (+) Transcript_28333:814-1560(+)